MKFLFRWRLLLFTGLLFLGSWTLLTRLYQFQIEDQSYYISQKPRSRVVQVREPGVRGVIQDRHGLALADNRQVYELAINLGEMRDAWIEEQSLKPPIEQDENIARKDIVEILEQFMMPKLAEFGVKPRLRATAIRSHYLTHGALVPYSFKGALEFEQFSQLSEQSLSLPGVYAKSIPRRTYPYGALGCHLLGYVQQWKKGDYSRKSDQRYDHYFGDTSGVAGIERSLNEYLTGIPGVKSYRKDERNQIQGEAIEATKPGQGCEVTLTLDSGIQHLIENILRRAGRAAAVVMDVNTGAVLAMASLPNYDPNHFVPSITQERFALYNTNLAKPFQNRAVTRFEPGSTTKLAVSLVGLLAGKSDFRHNCRGSLTYGRNHKPIHCHRKTGHGRLGLEAAIQRSCNPYFMDLAGELGTQAIVDGFSQLSLGKLTGIRLPEEQAGTLPGNASWTEKQRTGTRVTEAQLAMISIGQWQMQATPLQIASLTSCIANGGKLYQPRLVSQVVNSQGQELLKNEAVVQFDFSAEGVQKKEFEKIRRGMWLVTNESGGTATNIALANYRIAAKTGTVQIPPRGNNSWVTTFAPYENPRYAVTVFVEGGASGGKVAGPLAHMIIRGLAASEAGLKLPTKSLPVFTGHLDRIETIDFDPDSLIAIPLEEEGETGDEVQDVRDELGPVRVKPSVIPLPGGGR